MCFFKRKQLLKMGICLLFLLVILYECTMKSVGVVSAASPSGQAYFASQQFSSVQGQNNWYYQEWNGNSYVNMVWDNMNQSWQGSQPWLVVASNWQHPYPNISSVRKWVAPQTGFVRITEEMQLSFGEAEGMV